jgi:predicted double-glycine peptidase
MANLDASHDSAGGPEPSRASVGSYLDTCQALVHAARRLVAITAQRADQSAGPATVQALVELDGIGTQLALVEARLHRMLIPDRA